MTGKKVIIKVEAGHRYSSAAKGGRELTSVKCVGSTYGSTHPYDNEGETQTAINGCKRKVRENGDIPKVEERRMNFLFGLFDGDDLIDQTSLDENNQKLAEDLFFGEFGHDRVGDHVIKLIEIYP